MPKLEINIKKSGFICGGDGVEYHTWPSLLKLRNGDILCCTRYGTEKCSADGRLRLYRSGDGGKTWSEGESPAYRESLEQPEYEYRCCGLSATSDNEITATYLRFLHGSDGAELFSSEDDGMLFPETRITKSFDNGYSWDKPRAFELSIDGYSGVVVPDDGCSVLIGGELALPVETWRLAGKPFEPGETQHSRIFFSSDGGYTWPQSVINANDPSGLICYYDQRMCGFPDGRLMSLFWTHKYNERTDMPVHMSVSDERGRNWSPVTETNLSGQISCPIYLVENTFLAIYNCRSVNLGQGVKAVISYDGGVTWDTKNEKTLWSPKTGSPSNDGNLTYEDIALFWFGHPGIIRLGVNTYLVGFYCGDGKSAGVMTVHIEVL